LRTERACGAGGCEPVMAVTS